jgi:hypothetical protein
MNMYRIDVNIELGAVYYKEGKPNMFRVYIEVTLSGLKDQLEQINGRLRNNNDVRVMFSVIRQYSLKNSIEFTK